VETRVRTPLGPRVQNPRSGHSRTDSSDWLNRDSNAEYPANIPHGLVRSDCAKQRARRGWMHSLPAPGLNRAAPCGAVHPAMGTAAACSKVIAAWLYWCCLGLAS
jgi:hypothetical protein